MAIRSRAIIGMQGSKRSCFYGRKLDNDHQSNYIFKNGLLLTLYVDDVLLSGPEHLHAPFWTELREST